MTRAAMKEARTAYVHGARHDLWWEFALVHSFRWQALVAGMPEAHFRNRLQRLAALFGLTGLLDRQVEELTPAERARANVAVALLPGPDRLFWEEPHAQLPQADQALVWQALQVLGHTEGLTVVVDGEPVDLLPGGIAL